MFNTIVGAGAWAASCYGSGSDQMMQLQLRNTHINGRFCSYGKIYAMCNNWISKQGQYLNMSLSCIEVSEVQISQTFFVLIMGMQDKG
jgi:hypothetical protein